jgi:hypothetical protein
VTAEAENHAHLRGGGGSDVRGQVMGGDGGWWQ